jgi:hypothetical protein
VDDPERLLDLNLEALARGHLPSEGTPLHHNLLLVCTNAKRDRCCAIAGRALVEGVSAARPECAWECSHLGGHRFAPTALLLPSGYVYGRLTIDEALALVDAAPTAPPLVPLCRGRTSWDRYGQVAELAVRARLPDINGAAVDVVATGPLTRMVHIEDGRRVEVTLGQAQTLPARQISCGAEPVSPPRVSVLSISVVADSSLDALGQ